MNYFRKVCKGLVRLFTEKLLTRHVLALQFHAMGKTLGTILILVLSAVE